jgi:hypothetical protein
MAPADTTAQTFSFEVVSCLVAALLKEGKTLGNTEFAMMEKVDKGTTNSGYQHRFRSVKARAKEINEKITTGEIDLGATPAKTTSKKAANGGGKKTTPASKRSMFDRSYKVASHMLTTNVEARSEAPGSVAENDEDDEEEEVKPKTPSKKVKVVKEEQPGGEDDDFVLQ